VQVEGPVVGSYDESRIRQLLENLVENGVKYSPDGGAITVRLWCDGDWNHFTVSDNGIGIPAEDHPRIFQRFHRGANVDDRRFAGMGLGLFICHGIAEQHGGSISVESRPGGGTTFHVALPVRASASISEDTAAAASPQPLRDPGGLHPDIPGGLEVV
jgi:signal transduction histidine kinase